MENFITQELLDELGFRLVSLKESEFSNSAELYGRAVDKRTNGMTELAWNTSGHSVTYFGDDLEPNISISIKKDGGTRTAFSGYVFNVEDLKRILTLTW